MIKYLCDRCHAQIEPASRGVIFKYKTKFYSLTYYHRTSSDAKEIVLCPICSNEFDEWMKPEAVWKTKRT